MKRALAERAKQSLPQPAKQSLPQPLRQPQQPSTNASVSSIEQNIIVDSVGSSALQPPSKIPRISRAPINGEETRTLERDIAPAETISTIKSESPRSTKKTSIGDPTNVSVRPSSENVQSRKSKSSSTHKNSSNDADHSEQEEEDKASAFYLKHQNSALATELKSLQHAVTGLKEERDARRNQCHKCIQALHSLQATWTALETALQHYHPQTATSSSSYDVISSDDVDSSRMPPSTGADDSVEWTRALHQALEALGRSTINRNRAEDELPEPKYQRKRKLPQNGNESPSSMDRDLVEASGVSEMQIATNIASRANVLQECMWKLLSSSKDLSPDVLLTNADQEKRNALLEAEKHALEIQVQELASSRHDTATRERRIRRNVYRLAAGMLTADQVVKTNETDEQIAAEVELERLHKVKLEDLQKQNEQLTTMVSTKGVHDAFHVSNGGEVDDNNRITQAQADDFKSQISDLEEEVSSLKNANTELNELLKRKEQQITELTIKQISDDNAEKLRQFDSNAAKLKQETDRVEQLELKLSETRAKWAQALKNEKVALNSIDEIMLKFNKRWLELTGFANIDTETREMAISLHQKGESEEKNTDKLVQQAKQLIELQHKFDQALENVRQAESTRALLKEAMLTNATLQSKLEEFKAKYAAVQAAKTVIVSTSTRPPNSSVSESATKEKAVEDQSVSTPREKDLNHNNANSEKDASSVGATAVKDKSEKWHRETRRLRKDLSVMEKSKEAAKAKLERSEKERESLAESNARLLKQISEKDEVNAKSLSTILYLKGQIDILSIEKANLEQQAKSAGQLSMIARLAANAKDRVAEEVVKEKKGLEDLVERLEQEHSELKVEISRMALELGNLTGKVESENTELMNARKRIDDLTNENMEQREKHLSLETEVSKTKREARESKAKLLEMKQNNNLSCDVTVSSESNPVKVEKPGLFTVDQLTTHIGILKKRLACPVCHERDKQCIIMRCRHMHCQQCVDEQISNRSRKCPTCNNKFSEKDVEDIWLNT